VDEAKRQRVDSNIQAVIRVISAGYAAEAADDEEIFSELGEAALELIAEYDPAAISTAYSIVVRHLVEKLADVTGQDQDSVWQEAALELQSKIG
jgi:hypothetical protein